MMRKKRVVKPDGRYLILYEFDDAPRKAPSERPEVTDPRRRKERKVNKEES